MFNTRGPERAQKPNPCFGLGGKAMKNGKAPKTMGVNQFAEFIAAVIRWLPREMSSIVAQGWIDDQDALGKVLRKALMPSPIITPTTIQEIYTELGIECEIPKEVQIPQGVETGDLWTVMVPKGMTPGKAFKIASKLFKTQKYTKKDLDEVINEVATETTISFFKANVEADKENKNKSANDLEKEKGRVGINLTQRILLEVVYFKLTGQHLDKENITLCDESRYAVGDVPCVDWLDDEMDVHRYNPDDSHDDLRSRSAVL